VPYEFRRSTVIANNPPTYAVSVESARVLFVSVCVLSMKLQSLLNCVHVFSESVCCANMYES
jgi:hypothetical protein